MLWFTSFLVSSLRRTPTLGCSVSPSIAWTSFWLHVSLSRSFTRSLDKILQKFQGHLFNPFRGTYSCSMIFVRQITEEIERLLAQWPTNRDLALFATGSNNARICGLQLVIAAIPLWTVRAIALLFSLNLFGGITSYSCIRDTGKCNDVPLGSRGCSLLISSNLLMFNLFELKNSPFNLYCHFCLLWKRSIFAGRYWSPTLQY